MTQQQQQPDVGAGGAADPTADARAASASPSPPPPHPHHQPPSSIRASKSLSNLLSAALHFGRFGGRSGAMHHGLQQTPSVSRASLGGEGAAAAAHPPTASGPSLARPAPLLLQLHPPAPPPPTSPPLSPRPETLVERITSALAHHHISHHHHLHHYDHDAGQARQPPDEADEDALIRWPARADAYALLDECGRGASAVVYRARCLELGGREVSVKVVDLDALLLGGGGGGGGGMSGGHNHDDGPLAAAVREASTQAAYRHPNVLPLLCSFVHGPQLWMVSPYMAGGSVAHLMRFAHPKGLEEPLVCTIALGVLRALAYIHAHGGIHRDVKAGNVLLSAGGRTRLGDFGVVARRPQRSSVVGGGGGGGSKQQAAPRRRESATSWGSSNGGGAGAGGEEGDDNDDNDNGNSEDDDDDDDTARNTFAGTPCWMAPEVLEQADKGYDSSADIWSLGITLLELAHGHAPFAHLPPLKVLLLTLQGPPPQLEPTGEGDGGPGGAPRRFSTAMREVVALCLQKDPALRPTAARLLRHRWWRRARDDGYVRRHLLAGLPPLPERVAGLRAAGGGMLLAGLRAAGGAGGGAAARASAVAGPAPVPPAPDKDHRWSMQNYAQDVANWDFSCVLAGEAAAAEGATAAAEGEQQPQEAAPPAAAAAEEHQPPPPAVASAKIGGGGGGDAPVVVVLRRPRAAAQEDGGGGTTTTPGASPNTTRAPSPARSRSRSRSGGGDDDEGALAPPPSEVSGGGNGGGNGDRRPLPPPPTRRHGRFTVWEGARVEDDDDGGGAAGLSAPAQGAPLPLVRRRSLSSPDLRRDWSVAQRALTVRTAAAERAAEGEAPVRTGGRRVGFRGDVVGGEEEEAAGAGVGAEVGPAATTTTTPTNATAATTTTTTKGRFRVSSPVQGE